MEFKDRFKDLREEKELTQAKLVGELNKFSSELQVKPQSISYWENGREPDFHTLKILANFFEVSVDYLIGNSNIRNIQVNSAFTQDELATIEDSVGELWVDMLIAQFSIEKKVLMRLLTSKTANSKVIQSLFKTLNNVYQLYDEIGTDYSNFVFNEFTDVIREASSDTEKYMYLLETIKKRLSPELDNLLNDRINDIDNELNKIKDGYMLDLIDILSEVLK